MEQKDKELLLKDLCSRIPYGVKAQVYNHWRDDFQDEIITIENLYQLIETFSIGDIKPYLLPLSSMTEEQRTSHNFLKHSAYANPIKLVDWYNKNHFDYRGLIPMGSAIDATGLNIY